LTARTYDVILTVSNALPFQTGNVVIGNTTAAVGIIAGVDTANNTIKVKLANIYNEFSSSETIHSKITSISGTANGAINNASALPFQANVMSGNVITASASIFNIQPSAFIAEKNAFTQNPIVRLYSIYYPGEWYPTTPGGNPTESGEGRAWPADFPIRFAEIVGDINDDISYNVTYGGTSYSPFPVSISGIEQASDGKVNELSLTVFNADNMISRLVEDPYLAGNNISNAAMALVNGELVHGLDPRTINASPIDVGTVGSTAYNALAAARSYGLNYDEAVVAQYGRANATFTYEQTKSVNGIWRPDKEDSRDLLGGVVNIKTTFANFLDFWPEYSLISFVNANIITVRNSAPYRVGDNVRSSAGATEATVQFIDTNHDIYLSNQLHPSTELGNPLYIINPEVDTESYIEDRFKIDQLESLSDHVATFSLVSWLQYFKVVVPKRKYYKNTCQWTYKGPECQYPGPGGLPIPGTTLVSNTSPIGLDNQVASARALSVINMSSWVPGTTGSATGYTQNGDGNSRIIDSTPYGDLGTVWDVSNQDAATDADGGWNSAIFDIDNTKLYRFSVWIRRKNIGNGFSYLGLEGLDSGNADVGVLIRSSGAVSTNPYFYSASWPYTAGQWMLLVGHVWPVGSGTGAAHVDTGVYNTSGTKVTNMIDFVWQTNSVKSLHRSYLFNSTDTATNQQFYDPRVDIVTGLQPTISELVRLKPEELVSRTSIDTCSKSLAACTVRNNQIHFGGFPGVGRSIPRA
jgi:phage-related protein